MWAFAKLWVIRLAALRYGFKLFGLATLLPVAFLLKFIGLPVLMVLLVLGFPVLMFLFILGLPVFLVLLVGGGLLAMLALLLPLGLVVLKVFLFVVVPVWLMVKLFRWVFRRGRDEPPVNDTTIHDGPITPEPPIP